MKKHFLQIIAGILLPILPLVFAGCVRSAQSPVLQLAVQEGYGFGEKATAAGVLPTPKEPEGQSQQAMALQLRADAPYSLDEAISMALARNPRVRMILRAEGIADDAVNMALSQYFPSIEITGAYHARGNDPGLLIPETGFEMISGEKDGYFGSILARYLLTDFGGRYFRVKAAKLDSVIARITTLQGYRKIILEVTEAYFNLLAARHFSDVAADSHELLTQQVKVSQDLFEHGMVAKNDVLSAEIGLAQASQTLITAENNIAIARAALNFLLGADIDSPTNIVDIDDVPVMALEYKRCLLMAVDNRPELKRLKKEKEQALTNLGLNKSEFAPNIVAEAGYTGFTDKYMLNKEFGSVGFFFKWDLIKGGKIPAKIRQARRFVETVEDRIKLQNSAVALEVKIAFLRCKENQKKIGVAQKAVEQAKENLRIFQDQYQSALVSITDILGAQDLLTQSRFGYLESLYGYHLALAKLENAVGARFFR